MRRLIEEAWRELPDLAAELRDHWRIDNAAVIIEVSRTAVEKAARLAPEDDRVWLARAHIATLTGQYDEAGRWLDACLERRPEDPALWRARLVWARAADRTTRSNVRRTTCRPTGSLRPRSSNSALVRRARGDTRLEREALERLVAEAPGETTALERLAVLAVADGRAEDAAEYRRRKAEADRAKVRYLRLLEDQGVIAAFPELAVLAESLGRWFEAEGWWTLAMVRGSDGTRPRAALARLARREAPPRPRQGLTLADALRAGDRGRTLEIAGGRGIHRSSRSAPSPPSVMTPPPLACISPTRTAARAPATSPRRWAGASG